MTDTQLSSSRLSLIWFGAALSIAEIMTGTYFAPLGFSDGLLAIIIGHIIGCLLLFGAGLIGAREHMSSMQTVSTVFGNGGMKLFSILNVLQLIGWTGIMIYDGALGAVELWNLPFTAWTFIIGALIIVWLFIGIRNMGYINSIMGYGLGILCIYLLISLLQESSIHSQGIITDEMTFTAALELSIAMPLSWLPLISDYTRLSKNPVAGTASSAIVYGITSSVMYVLGLAAALYTNESNIAKVLLHAGLGFGGLIIIVFSTVTTTFMDALSAGISSESLQTKYSGRTIGIIVTIIGTIGASIYPMDNIIPFLYMIGSVFAPMIAILLTHYFLLRHCPHLDHGPSLYIICWASGTYMYHQFLDSNPFLGASLSTILGTALATIATAYIISLISKKKKEM